MSEHQGSCHCGRTRLLLREEPSEAGECNCSICRRTASLWHYCPPDAVTVEGEGISYQQGDRALDLWHCPTCGCITHWTATDPAYQRMGLNLRMFEPSLWRDLPRRMIDGARY
ncbi:GFA family protein [Sphingomonas sp. AX6]|uniref:GFA family protein n=1 Tax=Sphingomonas sp. AX6 TaxID=2653171 RepID=UPI0012F00F8D|nr:GFA family protein [Sphingomonas sp. AX6]VXC80935.1 Aldehyde-activating protein [Sphingomonas sp. AX6]